MPTPSLIDRLTGALPPKSWTTDPELVAGHLIEWRGRFQGQTPLLVMPDSTEEVARIVGLCAESGIAITPQGGNTGLVGAQIPAGEVLISLPRPHGRAHRSAWRHERQAAI